MAMASGSGMAVKQPERESGIAAAIMDLQVAVGVYEEHLGHLVAKVQPLVRDEPPGPNPQSDKQPRLECEMAQRIREQISRIRVLNEGLSGLVIRLDP